MQHQLQTRQHLKHRQKQQRQRRTDLLAGACADGGLNPLLLLRDGNERKVHAAQRDHVAKADGTHVRIRAVDADTALGADVGNAPAAVVIARQDGMTAGYGRIVEHHVAAGRAPDKTLPVRHGDLLAGGRGKPRPTSGSRRKVSSDRPQRHRISSASSGRIYRRTSL